MCERQLRTTVLTPSGGTQLDVRLTRWVGTMFMVSGRSGAPIASFPSSAPDGIVIASMGAPGVGAMGTEGYETCTAGTCSDAAILQVVDSSGASLYPLFGDDSVAIYDARSRTPRLSSG